MKILVVTGIFPPDGGGPASYVPAMAATLAKKHEILGVITLSDREHPDDAYPYPVIRIPRGLNRLWRTLKTVAAIRRLTRSADLVYLNGLVLEGIIAGKLLGSKPVVVKVVGDLVWEKARVNGATQDTIDEFQVRRHALRWQLMKRLQSWYMKKADRIITPSRYLARLIVGWRVSPERVRVIYNAVDPDGPAGAPEEASCDVVTVARLVPWKGISELIELAAANRWKLKIVGDGPLLSELQGLAASKGAADLVVFTGKVARENISREIRSGRVFVLNSSYEGLPHVILEAKTAGVPVVASAVGGIPETITDGVDGRLVPAGDRKALERAIGDLLERPQERARLAEAGRRQVEERFSYAEMARETDRCLIEAAQSPAC